jgi:hypothetical protein
VRRPAPGLVTHFSSMWARRIGDRVVRRPGIEPYRRSGGTSPEESASVGYSFRMACDSGALWKQWIHAVQREVRHSGSRLTIVGICGSGKKQATFGLRYRSSEITCCFDPLGDHEFCVRQRFLPRVPVCGTPWKFWRLGDERLVFLAPVEDDLILIHSSPSASLYRTITLRTCRT